MVKSITKLILGTCMLAGVMYGSDVRCMEEVKEGEKGITFDSTTGVLTIEKSQKEDIAEFPLPEGVRPDQVIKMVFRNYEDIGNCVPEFFSNFSLLTSVIALRKLSDSEENEEWFSIENSTKNSTKELELVFRALDACPITPFVRKVIDKFGIRDISLFRKENNRSN